MLWLHWTKRSQILKCLQVLRAEQLKLQGPGIGSVQTEPEGGFTASTPFWSSVIHARCAHAQRCMLTLASEYLIRDIDQSEKPLVFLT